jgi:hypothetical protein
MGLPATAVAVQPAFLCTELVILQPAVLQHAKRDGNAGLALTWVGHGWPTGRSAARGKLSQFVAPVSFALARCLVLQPGFIEMRSSFPMGAAGALLMMPTPLRPREHGVQIGRARPDQMSEQAAQLGHGMRQQVQTQIDAWFFPRPPRRGVPRSDRHGPALPE